jgi:hypothetical protein
VGVGVGLGLGVRARVVFRADVQLRPILQQCAAMSSSRRRVSYVLSLSLARVARTATRQALDRESRGSTATPASSVHMCWWLRQNYRGA